MTAMQLSLDQDGKYARGGLGSGTADCRLCAFDDVKQRAALRFTVVHVHSEDASPYSVLVSIAYCKFFSRATNLINVPVSTKNAVPPDRANSHRL